jgi:hypothetical protein
MTTLETIFIILFWIILGFWLCYKRNWYKDWGFPDNEAICVATILFSPVALVLQFIKFFIVKEWRE